MAMNKFAFGLLLVVWFMFSCTDRSTGGAWDVDLMEVSADSLDYSLFVDSIRYIPLECTEECMVGAVTDVAFAEDNIFVFDIKQQTVWVFSREGAYESCVSRQGNGPGEYVYISQFEYDKQHGRIAVLASGQGQILYYSPRGEHLGTVNLSVKADDFKLTPQDDIILSCAGRDDASAGIYVTDAAGQNARPLVLRRENHLVYATFPWELCAYDDVVCFMAPNFENGVYHWEGGGLSLAYPFRMLPEPGRITRKRCRCSISVISCAPLIWRARSGFWLLTGRQTRQRTCGCSCILRRRSGIGWDGISVTTWTGAAWASGRPIPIIIRWLLGRKIKTRIEIRLSGFCS